MEGVVARVGKASEAGSFLSCYRDKRVLITGHTGFKGAWLSQILINAGAHVVGYALDPPTQPSMFEALGLSKKIESVIGDIREFSRLSSLIKRTQPEIVFHLAAQPLVLEGYRIPRETFEINVMGTVNLLEACRGVDFVRSIVNVTTDKVYLNRELPDHAYREDDALDGYDPYSNSKSCSDLVTHSYRSSFFEDKGLPVSTMRAGNVIGGGDFSKNRIVPDCARAALNGAPIKIRNPWSVRPYQHVLDPLFAYLALGALQEEHPSLASSYNIGPDEVDCVTTAALADLFVKAWDDGLTWIDMSAGVVGPHEAQFLKLDSSKLKESIGWVPVWNIQQAIQATVEWFQAYAMGSNVVQLTNGQIQQFEADMEEAWVLRV